MKLHIACVTGDGFVNMYVADTEAKMWARVAGEFVSWYPDEASDPAAVKEALNDGEWKIATEMYFEDNEKESLFIGTDGE